MQSLWAGVERIAPDPRLTQPLARMVDPGLARGMAEYCSGWAMRAHLGMDAYRQDGQWRHGIVPPLAPARRVTILGMGELGRATAQARAWTRRGARLETIAGQVPPLHSMPAGCRFAARCPHAWARCREESPGWSDCGDGHRVRCHLLDEPGRAAVAGVVVGGQFHEFHGVPLLAPGVALLHRPVSRWINAK